jgi:esterase/lipase
MSNDPLMKIKSIKGVAKHIGRDIATEMMVPIKEMKEYIKPKEVASIVKQYAIYKDGDYFMNTLILQKIFSEVKNWVLGIQLAKMASSGKMDTMWDEEQNCMIFKSV